MSESFGYIYDALILAVVFIYLILASQFGSFVHPFSIMLSLPLSLIGVVAMLWAVGDTLNIMSMIGLILLMGLVTKNAILLIDYANKLRKDGTSRDPALVKAGGTRFRPIVMTTLAMIFGMLPLAFEIGAGSEIRAPMARAVIGGLITSTLAHPRRGPGDVFAARRSDRQTHFAARTEPPGRRRRGRGIGQ